MPTVLPKFFELALTTEDWQQQQWKPEQEVAVVRAVTVIRNEEAVVV